MNKNVSLGELLGARIVLAILHCGILLVLGKKWLGKLFQLYPAVRCDICFNVFSAFLAVRERKYKKETVDEMAAANLKRCDSICYKITMVLIVCIAFCVGHLGLRYPRK